MRYWHTPDSFPVDARAVTYSIAFFSAKHLGQSQYCLMSIRDADGEPLDGGRLLPSARHRVRSADPVTVLQLRHAFVHPRRVVASGLAIVAGAPLRARPPTALMLRAAELPRSAQRDHRNDAQPSTPSGRGRPASTGRAERRTRQRRPKWSEGNIRGCALDPGSVPSNLMCVGTQL